MKTSMLKTSMYPLHMVFGKKLRIIVFISSALPTIKKFHKNQSNISSSKCPLNISDFWLCVETQASQPLERCLDMVNV